MHTPSLHPERIIVVVDDNDAIRVLLADVFLSELGARVLQASECAQLQEIVADVVPDLVLLDVRLPTESGIDCVAWLRGFASTRAVPIIGMSAQEYRDAMLAAGADEFIAKPFDINDVLDLVGRVLGTDTSVDT